MRSSANGIPQTDMTGAEFVDHAPPGRPEHSEGLAELFERLCVATFKGEATQEQVEPLARLMGEDTTLALIDLADANRELWQLKDAQAGAVLADERDAGKLLALIKRDIVLCESRARIRAELNRRLGGPAQGESIKRYGNT